MMKNYFSSYRNGRFKKQRMFSTFSPVQHLTFVHHPSNTHLFSCIDCLCGCGPRDPQFVILNLHKYTLSPTLSSTLSHRHITHPQCVTQVITLTLIADQRLLDIAIIHLLYFTQSDDLQSGLICKFGVSQTSTYLAVRRQPYKSSCPPYWQQGGESGPECRAHILSPQKQETKNDPLYAKYSAERNHSESLSGNWRRGDFLMLQIQIILET